MQANQKAAVTESTKKEVLQSSEADKQESMSKDDVKFVGELGWLSAAAVLVAGVAASI